MAKIRLHSLKIKPTRAIKYVQVIVKANWDTQPML